MITSRSLFIVITLYLAFGYATTKADDKFPATGQTACWNNLGLVISCDDTGQDGELRAGATLSYKDNGDGTITDKNTGLQWEKQSRDGRIHDINNTYIWSVMQDHVLELNTTKFARHKDWRLPNIKELQSIVNYQKSEPAISLAFNRKCTQSCTVLTCSCTPPASAYWSSTTFLHAPDEAWVVDFMTGAVILGYKNANLSVRAVRSDQEPEH